MKYRQGEPAGHGAVMALEIERKFLVRDNTWRGPGARGKAYRQGYVFSGAGRTVRVRTAGDKAFITLKGKASGFSRHEYEYEIPTDDAAEMLEHLCAGMIVEKTRYIVPHAGMDWEVDVFSGANEGLVLAEIELPSESHKFELPPWAGDDVTDDHRYYNAYLAANPFKSWPENGGGAAGISYINENK